MRVPKAYVAMLMVVAAVTAGCSGSDAPPKPSAPPADHSTSTAAAQPFGDAGPGTGPFRRIWQADLPAAAAPPQDPYPSIEFVAGQVVVISGRGLDVRDGRTGAARWHYYERSRNLAGLAVTADTLVVTTVAVGANGAKLPDDKADLRTTGFDAVSGRVLWRADRFRPLHDGSLFRYKVVRTASGGVAVLRDEAEKKTLIAVDARTGRQRWTWTIPRGATCKPDPLDGDGSLLVLNANCEPDKDLYALDAATGAVRWERPAHAGRLVGGSVQGGITMLTRRGPGSSLYRFSLIRADGKEILGESARRVSASGFAVAGDRAVVSHHDGDGVRNSRTRTWLGFVNTRTGKLERRVWERELVDLVAVGGRVYGLRSWLGEYAPAHFDLDPGLVPAALDAIDPGTSRVATVPLPFPKRGFWPNKNGHAVIDNVRIVGDRVYTARLLNTGLRLAAYASADGASPVELGGVRPDAWPDVCALLKGTSWARDPDNYPADPLRLGSASIRRWSCKVDGGAEVRIGWVAATAQEADELLDASGTEARAIPNVGDEAYEIKINLQPSLVVRAGRYVVVFDDVPSMSDPFLLKAARTVAKGLESR
ncbi:PQQ-binding-like beta-propeller repeat protein [Actinomadura sp. HBU206391]|uniref:outer membrane protein assembly factor BamB family protein n=1 Tax=Actinomadura sp. HBU206391 TaxID=2731692 RepID=UPI00164FF110|nr:PQQ-binding-like beta-propeller repeat protein [Actinomadura sp. HBU206391]MBC6456944.1 PQQ-binding-like beta-propeller repeat protein [Actinomadura sp. HBU206391]